MRVRFGELSNHELREKERLCENARHAWQRLRHRDDAQAAEQLTRLDARLELTVRRDADEGGALAELSALESSAWPLAELVLAQAPIDLDCSLSLGRMAVPLELALAEVRATHDVELERATLRAGFGRGHLLELTLGVPGGVGSENEQNAAENLVRALLGDRVFETWIGAVHVTPAPRGGSLRVLDPHAPRTTLNLSELFDTVAAAVCGVLQGLPESPRTSDATATAGGRSGTTTADAREEWTLLETEPLANTRGARKDDLILASTCTPELLRCYLDGSPCASRRFSRAGESFVFVSYEDDERTMQARVARRTEIEAALSSAVAQVGAVTGVGLGVKTTYVDLALCNLETGLNCLVSKLRDLGVPARTFIQFFDSELADEWLSIWPDSRLTEG
jgi:hypothetical protein